MKLNKRRVGVGSVDINNNLDNNSFSLVNKFLTHGISFLVTYLFLLLMAPTQVFQLFSSSTTEAFTLNRLHQNPNLKLHLRHLRGLRNAQETFLFDVPTLTTKEELEIAHVRFLTPFRSKRDLSEREFHILQVQRPSRNSTLTLHLTKKTTLLSPLLTVSILDGDANVTDASKEGIHGSVFSGTVTSTPNSDDHPRSNGSFQTRTSQGQVALSVCNGHSGFCGLIVTEDEHLFLQPHPKSCASESKLKSSVPADDSETKSGDQFDHVILRVDPTAAQQTCSATSDELRVPLEKLIEASALAASEHHSSTHWSRQSDHHNDGSSQHNKRYFESMEEAHETESEKVPSVPVSLLTPMRPGEGSNRPQMTVITSPSLSPRNHFRPDSFGSSSNSHPSTEPVVKSMATNNRKTVEIAVFTDEDLYNQLRKKYPKDTVKKIKDYVITMINSMDLLYQHSSLGIDIEFSLVHLEIMKKVPSKLNTNGGKAMAYLSSFCDYAGEKNVNSDMWDHALLLSGMDLKEDGTTATAGLAWAGTMCYRYYSCSISEGSSFGAAYIITHEIGHSLGMEHDGNGVSKSCDRDKFIMSPTTGPGKVEWSGCSKKNLKDFLQYGTSELRNSKSAHRPLCLSETSMKSTAVKIDSSPNSAVVMPSLPHNALPGQKYNASQQCILAMGIRFKPVLRKREPPFDNICWMLYCGNGTHAVSTHPALEGSRCDDGKHCRSGKCVIKVRS